jgi:transposase-like protein
VGLKTIFAQESKQEAFEQWNKVADALREKDAKLGELMDAAREEVLAYMDFNKDHWTKISSTNPLERLDKEIKRRTPSRVFLTRAASQSDDPSPDGSSSSGSFRTTPPSSASSAPSCSSSPTSGP